MMHDPSAANRFTSRFNAWFLDAVEEIMHRMYGADKQRLFRDLSGTVVEIGPGAGANMRYYPRGQVVIAVEP
ncbi:MAG: SAM-dependent methyltransferase, partial [Deltaproteobacteria bacterium]|nr:SAM-dependent methyltransferase [Deltaproteobacteria bacterium]